MRDELLDVEQFASLLEAQVVIEDWREDYDTRRPHSSLRMRSPPAFAAGLTQAVPNSKTNCSWGMATKRIGNAGASIATTAR